MKFTIDKRLFDLFPGLSVGTLACYIDNTKYGEDLLDPVLAQTKWPRHPATGFGDLARRRDPRVGGTAGSVSSSQVQPGCAPWRIHCRDGNKMSMTTSIP